MTPTRLTGDRPALKKVRCAIYTRVSTDQGLDQEFNSLDAQREASEAYIKSQAHEGWSCLKQVYDDGGYSGGSLERPALQRLLEDLKSKILDVIIVYKVDRLTRLLTDFAKLVELFDAHNVSFVSVTQSFNTTSSMGRLTLNVLLSFAQFEREVTGERIRDKVAASKKKGIWMGGIVPHGYNLANRKLLVNSEEAQKVRQIFDLYLHLKSLPKLAARLADLGMVSRQRFYGDGRSIGGQPFRTGALSHLLSNRIYIGEIQHHETHYPGEHEAIVDRSIFDAVQAELASRLNRKSTVTHKSGALLQGMLFDSKGNRMVPVHASKSGIRYRYYQSWVLNHGQKEKAGLVSRVPAHEIEREVVKALQTGSATANAGANRSSLSDVIERVDVLEGQLYITLKPTTSSSEESQAAKPNTKLMIPWSKQLRRRKRELIGPTQDGPARRPMRAEVRSRLLTGIAQGRIWFEQLITNKNFTINDIAKRHGRSSRSVRSTLTLALLAPDIVDAAVNGRLPRGITVTQMTDLVPDWTEQRRALSLD
ncbi:MAG TPA: recombinase family protein [Aestuariivirga sp.]|nr:recombinase family protein [Aestuariivirga sp.]